MKKRDLYTFISGLRMATFVHPRVTYAVNKNKRLVGEIIKDMEKAVEPDEEMKKFISEREALAKRFCEKDEHGNLKMEDVPGEESKIYVIEGQYDEKSTYRKELAKLEKKYDEAIKKHDQKVLKYNDEFLVDKSEFSPFMLPLSVLEAHETCPQNIMDLIHWMIDDTK